MRLLLVAFAAAFLPALALAQQNNISGTAAVARGSNPAGLACVVSQAPILVYNSNIYTCQSGTYTQFVGGGGSTRTWTWAAQALCQGSVASAPIWLPTSNAPSYTTCSSTAQQGEWQIPATTTAVNWGQQAVVPAGVTGSYTLSLTWRTADTTTADAITLTPSYACVAAGSSPDNPTYTGLTPFTINPPGSANANVNTGYTFSPTCAAGGQLRLLLTATANTFASPASISYQAISVSANQ
jgi:hypothetical protein